MTAGEDQAELVVGHGPHLLGQHCAVDLIRRESARGPKEALAFGSLTGTVLPAEDPGPEVVEDDLLRLVFTCCHPSLAPETQVALSLRTLCGMTTPEVARALLVSESSMAKRLTRARQKIQQAHIPYRVPSDAELPDRLKPVPIDEVARELSAQGARILVTRERPARAGSQRSSRGRLVAQWD